MEVHREREIAFRQWIGPQGDGFLQQTDGFIELASLFQHAREIRQGFD